MSMGQRKAHARNQVREHKGRRRDGPMTGQPNRRSGPWILSGGLLVLALRCCLARADGLPGYHYVRQWPEPYAGQALGEVAAAVQVQAHNGQVLEQTIWNYHFKDNDDTLRPSGKALLDRLARRQDEPLLGIYLQTAKDVKYDPDHPELYQSQQADLNVRRMKAIRIYLASTRPDVMVKMSLHDPQPLGMAAIEIVRPLRQIQTTNMGLVPPELQIKLSAALQGQGTAAPTSALQGTGTNSGAFGTE
jgi:hypothetical protein